MDFIIKYKKHELYYFLLFLIVGIFVGGCTKIFDYEAYRISYISQLDSFEYGYSTLEKLFYSFGFSFNSFKLAILTVSLYLIHRQAIIFTNSILFFYLLIIMYPLPFFAYAVRNTIGASIIISAIPLLFSKGKNNVIKYVALIIFATLFHTFSLFFLSLLFPYYCVFSAGKTKIILRTILWLSVGLTIVITLTNNVEILTNSVYTILTHFNIFMESKHIYFEVAGRWGFLLSFSYMFCFIFLFWICKKDLSSVFLLNKIKKNKMLYYNNIVEIMFYINLFMIITLPFVKTNSNFSRCFFAILPMNYIVLLMIIDLLCLYMKVKIESYGILLVGIYIFATVVWQEGLYYFTVLLTDNYVLNSIVALFE